MLEINDLCVSVDDNQILKGLNLVVNPGEVHAIMGPNGSGKSTLSKVIAGHPDYEITEGSVAYSVDFKTKNVLELEPDERAREGIFLAYQYPTEIPGVSNFEFLRAAFNAICKHQGVAEMDPMDFEELVAEKLAMLDMSPKFVEGRQLNVDFSGGEKKKNEILQMALLDPRVAFLDETDSGLDVDALRIVAGGVNKLRNDENSFVLITHYQRILNYIEPDFVHILYDGKIVKTGDKTLAKEIEEHGYDPILGGVQ